MFRGLFASTSSLKAFTLLGLPCVLFLFIVFVLNFLKFSTLAMSLNWNDLIAIALFQTVFYFMDYYLPQGRGTELPREMKDHGFEL